MERLGGGGHMNIAGCQMEGMTVQEVAQEIRNTLDRMIDEGELD